MNEIGRSKYFAFFVPRYLRTNCGINASLALGTL
jgi:hypothetical protein